MKNKKIFQKFMKARFPKEKHQPYISEWERRFMSGKPERYMDEKSLAIFKKLMRT